MADDPVQQLPVPLEEPPTPSRSEDAPRRKLTLSRDDHVKIQRASRIEKGEDYSVVTQRGKGFFVRSVHVFARHPTTKEINTFEQTASRLKFRGNKAELEGSQIYAAVQLYDLLIDRAYDVLAGLELFEDEQSREKAIKIVPPSVKRAAIRDLIAEVYSSAQVTEMEGEEDPLVEK